MGTCIFMVILVAARISGILRGLDVKCDVRWYGTFGMMLSALCTLDAFPVYSLNFVRG